MNKHNESVFQLSLTEIAFTLVLLLILLLGFKLSDTLFELRSKEQTIEMQKKDLQRLSSQIDEHKKQINNQANDIKRFRDLLNTYSRLIKIDPDDPADNLAPCWQCIAGKKELTEDEVQKRYYLGEEILKALAKFQNNPEVARYRLKLVEAAELIGQGQVLVTEQVLLNQMQQIQQERHSLEQKLNDVALERDFFRGKNGGKDKPSCLINPLTKKEDYLFTVKMFKDEKTNLPIYEVTKPSDGWTKEVERQVESVPGVMEMLEKGRMTQREFTRLGNRILENSYKKLIGSDGKEGFEACRYYVVMDNNYIEDARTAKAARKKLEEYFYKDEK